MKLIWKLWKIVSISVGEMLSMVCLIVALSTFSYAVKNLNTLLELVEVNSTANLMTWIETIHWWVFLIALVMMTALTMLRLYSNVKD